MFMKSSRVMLLAALFLSTPVVVFGGENPEKIEVQPVEKPKAVEAGMLSKACAFAMAPAVFAFKTAPDKLSQMTFHKLAALGLLKDTKVAELLRHKYTGRIFFLSLAAYAAYKLHQAYTTEEINEEPIFGDEYGN
jgi:hypothetical protein